MQKAREMSSQNHSGLDKSENVSCFCHALSPVSTLKYIITVST